MPLIYVVDDEPGIRQLAVLALRDADMESEAFAGAQELIDAMKRRMPDAVILDWMMPEMDGIGLTRYLRSNDATRSIPIIMLTAKTDEVDRVVGLEVGADDYITKPFGVKELAARVRALLRRRSFNEQQESDAVTAGRLSVDPRRRKVTKDGTGIDLTMREFDLLHALIQSRGQVFSREMLLDRVWQTNYYGDTRTVDVHVRYLRQKIEDDPSNPHYIQTIRGVGYCFAEHLPEEEAD